MKYVKTLSFLTAAWIVMSVTSPSYAQQLAYTSKDVELRAGPAWEYPVVAILLRGVPVSVQGCLSDYQWCDVVAGTYRGWTYAQDIAYPYQGTYYPMLNYGAVIGVGVIAFSLGHYWDQHYRAAYWYPQRQSWIDRPRPVYRPTFPHQAPPFLGTGEIAGQRPPQIKGPEVIQRPPHTRGSEIMQRPSHTQGSEIIQRPPRVQGSEIMQRQSSTPGPESAQRSQHGWSSEGGAGGRHR
jgi:uncharacterized protein YraI